MGQEVLKIIKPEKQIVKFSVMKSRLLGGDAVGWTLTILARNHGILFFLWLNGAGKTRQREAGLAPEERGGAAPAGGLDLVRPAAWTSWPRGRTIGVPVK